MSKNFDAGSPGGGPLFCVVCEREILGGNWFARIKSGNGRVALCCPRCAEKFTGDCDTYAHKLNSCGSVIPLQTSIAEGQLLAA
jgi:hypothetical protein